MAFLGAGGRFVLNQRLQHQHGLEERAHLVCGLHVGAEDHVHVALSDCEQVLLIAVREKQIRNPSLLETKAIKGS